MSDKKWLDYLMACALPLVRRVQGAPPKNSHGTDILVFLCTDLDFIRLIDQNMLYLLE